MSEALYFIDRDNAFMNITPQYLAGFIDGEGCFKASILHRRRRPEASVSIEITQVNLHILELIHAEYGGTICKRSNGTNKHNKINYIYKLNWRSLDDIHALLLIIAPYLICKQAQCNIILEYTARHLSTSRTRYTEEDWAMLKKVPILNKQQYLVT